MTISTPDDIKTTLKNRGVKTTANSQRPLRFIGSDAQRTFKEVAAELAVLFSEEDSDVATLGEFYETAVYKKGTTNEKTYEPSTMGSIGPSRRRMRRRSAPSMRSTGTSMRSLRRQSAPRSSPSSTPPWPSST